MVLSSRQLGRYLCCHWTTAGRETVLCDHMLRTTLRLANRLMGTSCALVPVVNGVESALAQDWAQDHSLAGALP